jgi:hypothetical protein
MFVLFQFTIPMVNRIPLTFRGWLPLRNEDALTFTEAAGIQLRFWIDKACLDHLGEVDLNAIHQYGNIFVGRIYVEASGITISDQLADVIPKLAAEKNWSKEHISSTYGPAVIAEYQSAGAKIYEIVINRFNHLIAYARAVKGQLLVAGI